MLGLPSFLPLPEAAARECHSKKSVDQQIGNLVLMQINELREIGSE